MKKPGAKGFTLTELLVAISVATIVGAALLSTLLYSFQIWTNTIGKSRAVAAADSFDLAFARDFSCACSPLGFEGNGSSCSFWTYRPAQGNIERLVRVQYMISNEGILSEAVPYPASGHTPPLQDHFATTAFRAFSYYGTNAATQTGVPLWEDPSNAPCRVSLQLDLPPGPPRKRFYLRRTP